MVIANRIANGYPLSTVVLCLWPEYVGLSTWRYKWWVFPGLYSEIGGCEALGDRLSGPVTVLIGL